MKKFEYDRFDIESDKLIEFLNGRGSGGWDLAHIREYGSSSFQCILKREVPDEKLFGVSP